MYVTPMLSYRLIVTEAVPRRPVSIWIILLLVFVSWWFMGQQCIWQPQSCAHIPKSPNPVANIQLTKNIITEYVKSFAPLNGIRLDAINIPMRDRLRKPKVGPRRKLTECGYQQEDFWWAVYPDYSRYFFEDPTDDIKHRAHDPSVAATGTTELVYKRMARQHLLWNRESSITGLSRDQVGAIGDRLESMMGHATPWPLYDEKLDELAANYSRTDEWKNRVPMRLDLCGYTSLDFWWSWLDETRLGEREFFGDPETGVMKPHIKPADWIDDRRKLKEHLQELWHLNNVGTTGLTRFQHERIWGLVEGAYLPVNEDIVE
jgi:hypothetical protein